MFRNDRLLGAAVGFLLTAGLPGYAQTSVVHDTAAAFAAGTWSSLEDAGSGSPLLRLSYDLPFGFGDGRNGVATLGSDPNARAACSGSQGSTTLTTSLNASPGDIVLIHQTRGSEVNTGGSNWELNRVVVDNGSTLTLENPLSRAYVSDGTATDGCGSCPPCQDSRAQVILVPQYSQLTINSLSSSGWNGVQGGIFAVMCSGSVTVNGTVSSFGGNGGGGSCDCCSSARLGGSGGGFRGGSGDNCSNDGYSHGSQGEGTGGFGCWTEPANGNGGGAGAGQAWSTGSGGGHGTAGTQGNASSTRGTPGPVAGSSDLQRLIFGGGGGGAGDNPNNNIGGGGGGGGILLIFGTSITVNGTLTAVGGQGGGSKWAGGGGAGGAIGLWGETVNIGTDRFDTRGGTAHHSGGAGGRGRVRVAARSLSGSLSSGYYGSFNTDPLAFRTSGSLRSAPLNLADITALGALSWTASGGGAIRARTRTAATEGDLASAAWSDWITVSGSTVTSAPLPWLQYEFDFTGDGSASPELTRVELVYETNNKPIDPFNLHPAVGAHINTDAPLLAWETGDLDGETLENVLTLSDRSDLGEPIVSNLSLGVATTYQASALADGAWYWQVRVWDGKDWNPNPAVFSFTVDTVPPVAPTLDHADVRADGSATRFTGTGENGTALTVLNRAGQPVAGTVTWDGGGGFTFTPAMPVAVGESLLIRSTDPAGNATEAADRLVIADPMLHLPRQLAYQGRALDANGDPLNGTLAVSVALYGTEAGGTALYTQHLAGVTADNGLYRFTYGDETLMEVLRAADSIWFEHAVNGEWLLPRARLPLSPYAVYAAQAATALVANVALTVDGDGLYIDPVSGRVGVGTRAPSADLHVAGTVAASLPVSQSASMTLPVKTVIAPAASAVIALPPDLRPRAAHRWVLGVNVGSGTAETRATDLLLSRYHPGLDVWDPVTDVGTWTVTGRDADDTRIDHNLSRVSTQGVGAAYTDLTLDNIGTNTVEILSIGVLHEGWAADHILWQAP